MGRGAGEQPASIPMDRRTSYRPLQSQRARCQNHARLAKRIQALRATHFVRGDGRGHSPIPAFILNQPKGEARYRAVEFWARMVFSCLVDADFLDTESFMSPETPEARRGFKTIATLYDAIAAYVEKMNIESSSVNDARSVVLQDCLRAAEMRPGVFSLTVPTGGGKTLSSMAFALKHALTHDLRRVIVVLPFTSIIEQNAEVYRKVFGADQVIEHHSQTDIEATDNRSRLASENWDAPVIVTTTVQFFESLFSNRPSACRKLHNIARSVVVLDEAQALPANLLHPILDALSQLTAHYGTSIVISTATQPALGERPGFPGLRDAREIVRDPNSLFERLRRVRVHWPRKVISPPNRDDADAIQRQWTDIAERVARHERVLAIVHRRDDARVLTGILDEAFGHHETFHLSALMCAEHRALILGLIREALRNDGPVRVVSTQLIEAGVDIDFPVVFRALGGLDSIAQSAGRCNREGWLAEGRVEIFVAPTMPPMGVPRSAYDVMTTMLNSRPKLSIDDPALFDEFFRRLFLLKNTDAKHIQELRAGLKFADVAEAFRMIEDGWTEPVVVPYGKSVDILPQLRNPENPGHLRRLIRMLRRYMVNAPKRAVAQWKAMGVIDPGISPVAVIDPTFASLYDERFGLLVTEDAPAANPRSLMA
ncbi:MAG: DEAD/DEAH box helicase [Deltaproteobacteria bacterium]|nr:DEAD/DEAH box helicase [Deltaproteobacteria bacterium]